MKLLAIDSNSILNRAYYGVRPLTTKDGVYTNGIYGFFNIFYKMLDEIAPDAVVFAFDLKAPTFRHKAYADYKGQRKGMPEELAMQLPYLKDLIAALGYRIVTCEGYEADDILGTFARACTEAGDECVIATGDRDSLQLVGERVTVRLATTKMGRPESVLYTTDEVWEKYGVTPRELIQVKALMGDASDNIPGVAGIGEKTALGLISRYHSVDEVYAHIGDSEIKPGVRKKLVAGREMAYTSLMLAEIFCEVPVDAAPSHYLPTPADLPRASQLLTRLELYNLMKKLDIPEGLAPVAEAAAPADTRAPLMHCARHCRGRARAGRGGGPALPALRLCGRRDRRPLCERRQRAPLRRRRRRLPACGLPGAAGPHGAALHDRQQAALPPRAAAWAPRRPRRL